jgi:hypothetical protein
MCSVMLLYSFSAIREAGCSALWYKCSQGDWGWPLLPSCWLYQSMLHVLAAEAGSIV